MKNIEQEITIASLLDIMSQASITEFQHNKKKLSFKKGQLIIQKGQKIDGVYIVKSGKLRVYSIDSNGNEKPIYHLNAGEICVFSINCSLNKVAYPAWVSIDSCNAEVISISSRTFKQLYQSESVFRDYIIETLSKRIFGLMSLIEEASTFDLGSRINSFLVRSCGEDNILRISHQDIANSLGTAREVVSRHLKELEKKDYLKLSRMKIQILSPQELAKSSI